MSENVIVVKDIGFNINGKKILNNISFSVDKGEFVGLIGPNGAGKTTLLKCLNGINKFEGTVSMNEKSIFHMSDKGLAAKISMMHQNTSIEFPFSALDVVLMGRYPHLKRLQRESKADYHIARDNMHYTDTLKLEDSSINDMSGGERQRVLFAKTLTQQTDIILLDEPTASLDITYQEQIFKYSKELTQQGKTVIAAIHDLKIAARYCTRLILMNCGEIVADGKPEEVLTSENISKVYCVKALVYKNRISGLLDFYISRFNYEKRNERIHVIGGAGSAYGVLRELYERGFYVSAGVFSHGDSDIGCAEVFGIEFLEEKPFNDISDGLLTDNIMYIKNADMTILCNMPFGKQNIKNLEAARYAQKLVIIENEPPESRDFTGGEAVKIYNELKSKAVAVITAAQVHEVLN